VSLPLQYSYVLNILMRREICKARATGKRTVSALAAAVRSLARSLARWLAGWLAGCNISEMCLGVRPCAAPILNSSRHCVCPPGNPSAPRVFPSRGSRWSSEFRFGAAPSASRSSSFPLVPPHAFLPHRSPASFAGIIPTRRTDRRTVIYSWRYENTVVRHT